MSYGQSEIFVETNIYSFYDVGLILLRLTTRSTLTSGAMRLRRLAFFINLPLTNLHGLFVDDTLRAGLAEVGIAMDAKWVDFEGDGVLDLMLRNREGVQLYRGLGNATFEQIEVTVPGIAPMVPGAPGAPGRS